MGVSPTFTRTWFVSRTGKILSKLADGLLIGTLAGPVVLYLWFASHIGTEVAAVLCTGIGGLILVSNWVKGVARHIDHVSEKYPGIFQISFSLLGVMTFIAGLVLQLDVVRTAEQP